MANEKFVHTESLLAGADLSTHQFKFVKLSAARKVVIVAAITDIPIGVLQNKPDAANKEALVMVAGRSKINSGEALAVADVLGTAGDGQGAPIVAGTDTTQYILGQVLVASGAAAEMAEAVINCAAPARAA